MTLNANDVDAFVAILRTGLIEAPSATRPRTRTTPPCAPRPPSASSAPWAPWTADAEVPSAHTTRTGAGFPQRTTHGSAASRPAPQIHALALHGVQTTARLSAPV